VVDNPVTPPREHLRLLVRRTDLVPFEWHSRPGAACVGGAFFPMGNCLLRSIFCLFLSLRDSLRSNADASLRRNFFDGGLLIAVFGGYGTAWRSRKRGKGLVVVLW
jgi:hypothetical protein